MSDLGAGPAVQGRNTLIEDAMNATTETKKTQGTPRTTPHRCFLDDDVADGHEHGERMDGLLRKDELAGTSASHAPPPDTRGGVQRAL
jgi:hypothetical protein